MIRLLVYKTGLFFRWKCESALVARDEWHLFARRVKIRIMLSEAGRTVTLCKLQSWNINRILHSFEDSLGSFGVVSSLGALLQNFVTSYPPRKNLAKHPPQKSSTHLAVGKFGHVVMEHGATKHCTGGLSGGQEEPPNPGIHKNNQSDGVGKSV